MNNGGESTIKTIAFSLAILLIIGIISTIVTFTLKTVNFFLRDTNTLEDVNNFTVTNIINDLDIDIASTKLTIKIGDTYKIETNNNYITVKESNNKLIIKEKKHSIINNNDNYLNIYIPLDNILNDLLINTGSGIVIIDGITCDKLDLDIGAGNVLLNNITTDKTNIDAGSTTLKINNSTLGNLDFDAGSCSADIKAKIIGNSKIDAGASSIKLNLIGLENDYTVSIEKGLKSVKINNKNTTSGIYGTGNNKIKISGGALQININYIEE